MDEINFQKADFDDIDRFTKNLLGVEKIHHPQDYEAHIAYISATVRVLIARRNARSANELAQELNLTRSTVGLRIEHLTTVIDQASKASENASASALVPARRMVWATWGLVIATGILSVATGFLVFYTRLLVLR